MATPLELLFDLCFVVAVGLAVTPLHHAIAGHHAVRGLHGFLVVFFAIWWAWMNFTWFAGAYDNDDVVYRVTTLVQIAGALVPAAALALITPLTPVPIDTLTFLLVVLVAVNALSLRRSPPIERRRSDDLECSMVVSFERGEQAASRGR